MLYRVLPKSREKIKETHYQYNSCQNVEITLGKLWGGQGREFSSIMFRQEQGELNVLPRKLK